MKDKKRYQLENDQHLRENPFSVPKGYFENLSSRIMEGVKEDGHKPEPKRLQWYTLRSQIALAASIIGFAILSYALISNILSRRSIGSEFVDITLLEEMNIIPEDAYLIDLFTMEEEANAEEEDLWESEAIEYLANNDIEIDLLLGEF